MLSIFPLKGTNKEKEASIQLVLLLYHISVYL